MILLGFFAFLAGLVTILSPCILPVLPLILASTTSKGKAKPLGIVFGFIFSFTFFTVFLSTLIHLFHFPADLLRNISIIIVLVSGLSLLIPKLGQLSEKVFSRVHTSSRNQGDSFASGFIFGLSLGLLWTPCVGPILASVITLAASSTITLATVTITLLYSLGTALPMFLVMIGGQKLLRQNHYLLSQSGAIQKFFGVVMILLAVALFFNADLNFQNLIIQKFPQYGAGLTQLEDNPTIKKQLKNLQPALTISGQPLTVAKEKAPEFIAGGEWFNSKPLTLESLKGKVVLVDFWTYTCINCIRTLPFVKSWYAKYKDQGFVVVGVHTPEFEFEKLSSNVGKAIKSFGIEYPVVQDNNYATWRAYDNEYWPAEYLIDNQGFIRHTHFGEGEYDLTEQAIQTLLKEAGQTVSPSSSTLPDQTPQAQISPETYFGAKRMQFYYLGGNTGVTTNTFSENMQIPTNSFSLGGQWSVKPENAESFKGSSLIYKFHASKVYAILNPGSSEQKVKVELDGQTVSDEVAGSDARGGVVTVNSDRLYNLIDLKDKTETHILRVEFEDSGTQLFTLTFG